VQLGCCLALVLVPLLLLATPQRATLHGTGHHTGAAPRRGDRELTRLSTSWTVPAVFATAGTKTMTASAPYAGVESVSFRQVVPTTTTTTTTAIGRVPSATSVRPALDKPAAVASATKAPTPPPPPRLGSTGLATWYGSAAGTCASPTLASGTVVTVTDVSTTKAVRCTVDDREAHNPGRVIDLSPATFSLLASLRVGVIEVRLSW
jgi:rare lipoprotein A (peptidoglycan hydrolase)